MKCKYCNMEIDDTDSYCSYCGKETTKKEIRYCGKCGNKMHTSDVFCQNCGTRKNGEGIDVLNQVTNETLEKPQTMDHNTIKQEDIEIKSNVGMIPESTVETKVMSEDELSLNKKVPEEVVNSELAASDKNINVDKDTTNYYKSSILWIITIALFLVSMLLGSYVQQNNNINPVNKNESKTKREKKPEIDNADIGDFVITKDTTIYEQQSNINQGGNIFYHNEVLYIAKRDGVVSYNQSFEEQDIILEKNVSYIYVNDTYIYYADENFVYYRMNLETKEEEMILDEVYFPQHVGGLLYYQNDMDGESIHCYNLETKEDQKLNDVRSYDMYVDVEKNSIYYEALKENQYVICRMDLDGQNNEELILDANSIFTYNGNAICYESNLNSSVYSFDVVSKEKNKLFKTKERTSILYLDDTTLYWNSQNTFNQSDIESLNEKNILGTTPIDMQGIAGNIICWVPNGNMCAIYILDSKGNCAYLTDDYSLKEYYKDQNGDYDSNDYDDRNLFDL